MLNPYYIYSFIQITTEKLHSAVADDVGNMHRDLCARYKYGNDNLDNISRTVFPKGCENLNLF